MATWTRSCRVPGPGPTPGCGWGWSPLACSAARSASPPTGSAPSTSSPPTRSTAAAGREFLVATDARRKELYWARYSATGVRLSGPEVAAPAALPAGLPVAGEGAHAYPELLGEPIAPRYPSAATAAAWCAARLAAGEPLGPPDPLYLRRPDARVPGAPKSVLAAPAFPGGAKAIGDPGSPPPGLARPRPPRRSRRGRGPSGVPGGRPPGLARPRPPRRSRRGCGPSGVPGGRPPGLAR